MFVEPSILSYLWMFVAKRLWRNSERRIVTLLFSAWPRLMTKNSQKTNSRRNSSSLRNARWLSILLLNEKIHYMHRISRNILIRTSCYRARLPVHWPLMTSQRPEIPYVEWTRPRQTGWMPMLWRKSHLFYKNAILILPQDRRLLPRLSAKCPCKIQTISKNFKVPCFPINEPYLTHFLISILTFDL